MDRTEYLLLHEAFAYEVAVRFGCGQPTIREFEARLSPAHVDALLGFAAKLQYKLDARNGSVVRGGRYV